MPSNDIQLCNFHIHTQYCDGLGLPEDYAKAAEASNLQGIGFSGHAPIPLENDWCMKNEDLHNYFKEISQVQQTHKLPVFKGLEIDFLPDLREDCDSIASKNQLDYYIGSVHFVKHPRLQKYETIDLSCDTLVALCHEWFEGSFFKMIAQYYSSIIKMLKNNKPDIVGHIDLVQKFNSDSCLFSEDTAEYEDLIAPLLDILKKHEAVVEINTGAIARGYPRIYPTQTLLKKLNAANIQFCLNADSHSPENICTGYSSALTLLKDAKIEKLHYPNGIVILKEIS